MPPRRAVAFALAAAVLFGASTPAAKILAGDIPAFLLAGLLYAGSGIGLSLWIALRSAMAAGAPTRPAPFGRGDLPWLAGSVLSGGVAGPVLLMQGLGVVPGAASAATASLLLNLEGAFTALIAWFVFRENFDRRIALGMLLIVAAGALVSLEPGALGGVSTGALFVAAACLAWAIDNNLTRRISAGDPVTIAAIKGIAAGAVNVSIALSMGVAWPSAFEVAAAGLVGLFGYGVSLALFVVALRELGTARTSAYFSVAPFAGIALALAALGEVPGPLFWLALPLAAAGVWLHVSERHAHEHLHEPLEHTHSHVHDEHHRHAHDFDWDGSQPHTHAHRHPRMLHSHPHYPDIHHRHPH
jgi:drug/metabolite transporter (DMT)-like permease